MYREALYHCIVVFGPVGTSVAKRHDLQSDFLGIILWDVACHPTEG